MDPASIALLLKLAPYAIKGASVVYGNIHQDITNSYTLQIEYQHTQQEYYKTLRVYYLTRKKRK